MSSTATATRPVTGSGSPDKAAASLVNNFRLATVTQHLRHHIQPGTNCGSKDFQICCISLAKGIDFAIANNEVPKKIEELPFLLKQLCRHKTDVYSKTAITVLMISVKHACQLGWFSDTQGQELTAIADELRKLFGSFGNTIPAIQTPGPIFSQIMERFYPFVKLGHVLVSLQVEAGYTMLAHDFHISKDMPHSLKDKIRLFVVQTDNTDTAACIINPPEVSFILNGKPVEKRANISMDSGPQLPTNVTVVLKYGTNLLQVMGNFKGPYIIIIAFTGVVLPPQKPVLKDYLQSGVVESNPDSDVIEGASRVSLSCPISRSRIKLPVKGQLCKHLQCFDFSNYVNINMRNPSWRCPHCNQPVCYPDIRLDQNMVKILKGAGSNAADVIINADGTWNVAKENDESEEPVRDVIIHDLEDPTSFLNSGPVVLDLTGDDDDAEMELVGDTTKVEDRKPHLSDAHGQSNNENSNKDASDDDYTSIFNISDVISLDQLVVDQLSALGNTVPQPPQALNTAQDPISVPVPFAHTSSPRDRPATTSTIFTPLNPSHRLSQVHASPVTPTGQYHGRTSNPRWNQTFQSQAPSVATVPQMSGSMPHYCTLFDDDGAPVGPTQRSVGSTSVDQPGTSRARRSPHPVQQPLGDDEDGPEDPNQPPPPPNNALYRKILLILRAPRGSHVRKLDHLRPPGTYWFGVDNEVARSISNVIKAHFPGPFYNWTKSTQEARDQWFETFTHEWTWEEREMIRVRRAFEQRACLRLNGTLCNWRAAWRSKGDKAKPRGMALDVWQGLVAHWKTPEAEEKSQSASNSRNTPVAPGDVPNRHRLGQTSIAKTRLNMIEADPEGAVPPIVEVLDRAYRKPDGSYMTKRAEKVRLAYETAVSQQMLERESQGETSVVMSTQELDQIYKQVAPKKKGRTLGLGCTDEVAACSSSSQYHTPPRESAMAAELTGLRSVLKALVAGNPVYEQMLNNVPRSIPSPPPPTQEQHRAYMDNLGAETDLNVEDYNLPERQAP